PRPSTSGERGRADTHTAAERPRLRQAPHQQPTSPSPRSRRRIGCAGAAMEREATVAAARAYDTAVFYLRGRSARLNFPDQLLDGTAPAAAPGDLTAAAIRKKAAEVGARVDALHSGGIGVGMGAPAAPPSPSQRRRAKNPDLNREPTPDTDDDE
uniref:AP2/ERF domain-containing protein n=1 Tax=Aegilops tauschii subsp. strangulata TaxID=200361 RepID=A0A453QUB4_AEGTS